MGNSDKMVGTSDAVAEPVQRLRMQEAAPFKEQDVQPWKSLLSQRVNVQASPWFVRRSEPKHLAHRPNATIRNTSVKGGNTTISSALQRIAELEKELAVAEERKTGLECQLHHLSDTVDDLRKRLDQSEGRVTALLSDQRPKSIWKSMFG